jgi:hypothetical protein
MDEFEKMEKAEKLKNKAGVSLEEAKAALEASGWDMLDALIYLEKQGKTQAGNVYSTESVKNEYSSHENTYQNKKSISFGEAIGKAAKWCGDMIIKGMENYFVIEKQGMAPIQIPITIFVILCILLNGFTIALLIIGLFFGFRYAFRGSGINNKSVDSVNDVLNQAGQKAEGFTNNIKDGYNHK